MNVRESTPRDDDERAGGTTEADTTPETTTSGTTTPETTAPRIGPRDWMRIAVSMFVIGFGANLFAPMLEVYREYEGIGQSSVTAMLGIYAAGLVPALMFFGPVSDRRGRRPVLRPALLLSGVGTVILALGAVGPEWVLFVGRFIAGLAVGMAMACGAAWIKQLSVDRPAAGPRRATVAVSAGFGGGPLVSGLVAQYLPGPEVTPYVVHLILLALVLPVMWNTPETQFAALARQNARRAGQAGVAKQSPRKPRRLIPRVALTGRFLWAVAAWAPWVFGTVSVAFAALPVYVKDRVPHLTAYIGLVAFVALFSGVLIQPTATRVAQRGWLPLSVIGLGTACAGMLLGAWVAFTGHPLLMFPAAIALGCSYGIMMVAGLREVETIADADELGALIGVFYALTYIGFFVPFALSLAAPFVGEATGWGDSGGMVACLLFGAVVCIVSIVPVGRAAERGMELAEG